MENQSTRDGPADRSTPVETFAGAANPEDATAVGEPLDAGVGTGSLSAFAAGGGTYAGALEEQAGAFSASASASGQGSEVASTGGAGTESGGSEQGQGGSGQGQGGGLAQNATAKVDAGLEKAAGGIDKLVGAIRDRGDELGQGAGASGKVGSAATAAADKLEGASQYLHQTDSDRLMSDLESLVRRKPVESLLVAAGIGFVVAKALR